MHRITDHLKIPQDSYTRILGIIRGRRPSDWPTREEVILPIQGRYFTHSYTVYFHNRRVESVSHTPFFSIRLTKPFHQKSIQVVCRYRTVASKTSSQLKQYINGLIDNPLP